MNYYSNDIFHDLNYISKLSYFNEWYAIVKPILLNDEFQKRKLFRHHDGSIWQHCVEVSYRSFLLAKYYHLDQRTCAIAGLLHDFYPKAYKYNEELNKAANHMESMNALYALQLENGRAASDYHTKYVADLQKSAQQSEKFNEELQGLTNNLGNLNRVYGGMLNAMKS